VVNSCVFFLVVYFLGLGCAATELT